MFQHSTTAFGRGHAAPLQPSFEGFPRSCPPAVAGTAVAAPAYAAAYVLRGMVAAGHGLQAVCLYLDAEPGWVLAEVAARGLPTPADLPLRRPGGRNPWTPEQVRELVRLWPSRLYATSIAARIGRTPASVRYKAKWLGLPTRSRASLVRAVPDQAELPLLPPPPPQVQHRGGQKKLALRVGQDRPYTPDDFRQTGLRWFAGQHSDGIARDLDRRPKQIVNLADRLELPPRHGSRNKLSMDYDPKRRLEEFEGQQFVLRQCLSGGNFFWAPKNGPRIAKATRNSKSWKDKTSGIDDASAGGTGYED